VIPPVSWLPGEVYQYRRVEERVCDRVAPSESGELDRTGSIPPGGLMVLPYAPSGPSAAARPAADGPDGA